MDTFCVEIGLSDNICTMAPPIVQMTVKSKNHYTRKSEIMLKIRRFYEILVDFYRFGDFPCVDSFQLHIILHISNADCAGFSLIS